VGRVEDVGVVARVVRIAEEQRAAVAAGERLHRDAGIAGDGYAANRAGLRARRGRGA